MWSIGNEVPSQWGPDGISELMMLQDLIHQLDPTRPVTCGMDQIGTVLENGFAAALDIPGFNYKPQHYDKAYEKLPQKMILGAETASTFSSRGIYYWPVIYRGQVLVYHPENQSNSYERMPHPTLRMAYPCGASFPTKRWAKVSLPLALPKR